MKDMGCRKIEKGVRHGLMTHPHKVLVTSEL